MKFMLKLMKKFKFYEINAQVQMCTKYFGTEYINLKQLLLILAGTFFTYQLMAEDSQSAQLQCRAKAKEAAQKTYTSCLNNAREEELDKIKKEYHEKMDKLKNFYDRRIKKLGHRIEDKVDKLKDKIDGDGDKNGSDDQQERSRRNEFKEQAKKNNDHRTSSKPTAREMREMYTLPPKMTESSPSNQNSITTLSSAPAAELSATPPPEQTQTEYQPLPAIESDMNMNTESNEE